MPRTWVDVAAAAVEWSGRGGVRGSAGVTARAIRRETKETRVLIALVLCGVIDFPLIKPILLGVPF